MFTNLKDVGFCKREQLISVSLLKDIKTEIQSVFRYQLDGCPLPGTTDSFDDDLINLFRWSRSDNLNRYQATAKICQNLPSLHALSTSQEILQTLKEVGVIHPVISTRPVLHYYHPDLEINKGAMQTPPHQDFRSVQGSLNCTIVWIPFIDVNRSNGTVQVIPGSHQWGLLETEQDQWYRKITKPLDESSFVDVEMRAGDVLFFSAFLVHRTGTNSTPNVRLATTFRYNDLIEPSFIDRGYPDPYIYKPSQELLFPNFPTKEDLASGWL